MSTAVDYIANELRGVNRNEVGAGEWAERIVSCLNRNGYVIIHPDARRARDEAIIKAACSWGYRPVWRPSPEQIDAIIATAEQETS